MVGRRVLSEIRKRCNNIASKLEKELGIYNAKFDLKLLGDTYWMKFKVEGLSGKVTYETPVFKEYDELPKWAPEDYEGFCTKVLKKMAELATEEY